MPTPTATPTPTALPGLNEVWLTPGEGGELLSLDGRVEVDVPAGAVTRRTLLRYLPQPPGGEPPPWLLLHFGLEAQDEQGVAVTGFETPVSLTYRFPAAVALSEEIGLHWWDEATATWQMVPSQIDVSARQLSAALDRVGLFGLGEAVSLTYGTQYLPTVHGFVTDEWSGNSSLFIPIELPPGPGGLGLRLGLNYSSEVVNGLRAGASTYDDPVLGTVNQDQSKAINFNAQASIVGWGWNLSGLGQITRNLQNGKWYLGYAGGGFELINDGINGWQTEPQSFLRISQPDRWLVWAPDGTRYTFGSPNWGNGVAYVRNTGTCNQQTREAHLTEVLDTHGNKIVITYATETRNIYCQDGSAQSYVRAIRPTNIEYFPSGQTNATARVDFTYVSRTDTGVPGKEDDYTESFWSSQRLSNVTVKVRSSATAFTTVRSYDLTQDYLWQDQAAGQGLLRLTGVTQKGKDGGALPAQTFTYTTINGWLNHTLLATANNGQGGKVTYSYENYNNIGIGLCGENTSRYRVSQMLVEDGLGTAAHNKVQTFYTHAQPYSWASGYPACNDNFEFGGYGFVRKEVKDGAGVLYQVVDNRYHQCGTTSPPVSCGSGNESMDPRKGKMVSSITSSQAGSGELARTAMTWATATVKGANWVYQTDTTNTLGASSQKTAYEYQAANQGGVQYGNVTHQRTYSDGGATLYRTQETVYFPANVSGGTYIVDRPAQELLKDATGTCLGETRTFYDGNTSYAMLPTQGDVTKVRVAQTACGGSWADTSYTYDVYGNQTGVSDPLGNTTTTSYDTTSGSWPMLYVLPTSVTAPLIGTSSYAWNKILGQVSSATDPNGAVTSYSYDQWGRQTQLVRPGDDTINPTLRFTYTNFAGASAPYWVKQEQKESGTSYLESRTFYDGLGRVVQTQAEAASSSQSIVTSARYAPIGVIQATVPYTHSAGLGVGGSYRPPQWNQPGTLTAYDALGRVTQTTAPDGTAVKSFYQNRQTAVLDELNRQAISETDPLGRLLSVKQYLGTTGGQPNWGAAVYAQVSYTYDVSDRIKQVTGPDGSVTTIGYDLLGRKTNMSDPDMGAWSYSYDAAGNLVTQTDARGTRLWYGYDSLQRVTQKRLTNSDGTPLASYTYDTGANGKGRRTGMSDPSGSTGWTYDARGRVTQETKVINGTGGGTFVTQWSYDSADRAVWQKYPGGNTGQIGEQVNFSYNSQGLLRRVQSNGSTYYVGEMLYNVLGQVIDRYLGSPSGVIRQKYTYSAGENFRLTALRSGVSPGYTNLQNITYTYDDAGNVLTIADAAAYGGSQTQTFSYDGLNRLLTAQATGGSYGTYGQRSYQYGAAGNITSFDGTAFYYQDAAHQHAVTHVGGTAAGNQKYWYDPNGNATRRINGSSDINLTYDAENRLTGMSGSVTASYVYDGDGKRVKETISGVTRVFVGDYYEVDNGVVKKYYAAGGARVALNSGGTTYYLLSDHLGSTATTSNSSGVRATELRYFPHGGARYNPGGQVTTYRFTGQRWDSGTALYFYGARWLDPVIGRFIQPDTIVPDPGDPQSLNRYSYVLNNPLRFNDPTGHCASSANTARGCPGWMPDWAFGALDIVAELTVMDTAFAPAPEGQTGDLTDLTERADARWYQGAAIGIIDVVDYADTLDQCTSGDCSAWRVAGTLLPGATGRFVGKIGAQAVGQMHHVFSNRIMRALSEHHVLRAVFNRDDLITQALQGTAHSGYQAWHRGYDQEVVEWLAANADATPKEFLRFLQSIYERKDMLERFPGAVEQIVQLLEELP